MAFEARKFYNKKKEQKNTHTKTMYTTFHVEYKKKIFSYYNIIPNYFKYMMS